jgi:signal transduction histidine kinase
MRGTSLSMRFTLATAGVVVLTLLLAQLAFEYSGKGRTDREFSLFAYQRAGWLASELEARLPRDMTLDKGTRQFLSRSAREMDLSIVLLHEADAPLITAHGPSLANMLRALKEHPGLGLHTDQGETPWEPNFDGGTDRSLYKDRGGRPVRVQEVWPYAVEAPVRANMTLRVVPLSQSRLTDASVGRNLVGLGMILLLASMLIGGRMARPIDALASAVGAASRNTPATPVPRQAFDETQRVASAVNQALARAARSEADRKSLIFSVAGAFAGPVHRLSEHAESVDFTAIPPPARPGIEAMRDDAWELQDVVDDMRHWADLEAGSVALEPDDVDLRHLLDDVVADLDCDVVFNVDDDVEDLVKADRAWLRVLLRHLVENAAEHGDGAVHIDASRGHTKVSLNIRDHGGGIEDMDHMRRIFQAFFRRETDEGGSLGLGLAISRHVINLHRGGLTARNHPDGGLEIRVWLPAPPIRVSEPDRSIDSAGWDLSGEHPSPAPPAAQLGPEGGEEEDVDEAEDSEQEDDNAPDTGEDPYAPF